MQYTQRKLQRSVTEMRRSRIGRARVSTSFPPANGAAAGGAARRSETRGMTFFIALFLWGNHSRAGIVPGVEKPSFRLAVVMQRRPAKSRWADFIWEPFGVVPGYLESGAKILREHDG